MNADKTPFAAKLRALSKDASPGPWRVANDDPQLADIDDADGEYLAYDISPRDATAIVFLRNAADRIADLVERVEAYREATDVRETFSAEGPHDDTMTLARLCTAEANAYRAMLAALDSLNGGGA